MEPAARKSRDHIAMVATPLIEVTHSVSHRVVEDRGALMVLGNPCRVYLADRHLEFWTKHRRFEISLEDLVATAGKALEDRLRAEIRDRVVAAQRGGAEQDGFVTVHPTIGP